MAKHKEKAKGSLVNGAMVRRNLPLRLDPGERRGNCWSQFMKKKEEEKKCNVCGDGVKKKKWAFGGGNRDDR